MIQLKMTKNIALIELQPHPTTIGGVNTHIEYLSRELKKRGHKVTIITSRPSSKLLSKNKLRKDIVYVGIEHKKFDDFKGINKLFYYLWRFFFEIIFVISLTKTLRRSEYNIIDVQSPITPALACSFSGKKYFITAHGIHHQGFKKLYSSRKDVIVSRIGSTIYKIFERYNIKRATRIICLGQDTLDYYSKFNDCVIIPNGIDTEKFKSKNLKRKKVIISVGRFTEQKQVDKLVKAMDNLPDYVLKVIGLGPLEEQIKTMCSKRKNCEFLGYKDQEEISLYLQEARFMILPSLFEGLPISMLEGMSCGVIPVTTMVGDIPIVVKEGKTGFFLKNNSPEEIIKTVRKAEKTNVTKISRSCTNLIKKDYAWEKITTRFLEAWEK
ncbi:MAG: glycosyltransferase family 4 protein [Nanoarchaeota archaeon]|nr:glycosyltransferase family 4 protein [Nanoarchaeota archaeon]MBU0977074.1 glycosyltransferase family 4 protein [Nanoarchaeota archaeon]